MINNLIKSLTESERKLLVENNRVEGEDFFEAHEDAALAWCYAKAERLRPATLNYVKNIHYALMRRLNPEIAGRFREKKVYVGNRDDCSLPGKVKSDMEKWCKEFNLAKKDEDEIIKEYIRFMKIHPFEDGNGRTGRILMNIQRINNGYGLHIIMRSDKIVQGEDDYYGLFR
ncbi:Fic family protein [Candidatus Pacearchaeota archaeon]|nr:Fic family protein [Candidatus Pacearchaeota archaeon]